MDSPQLYQIIKNNYNNSICKGTHYDKYYNTFVVNLNNIIKFNTSLQIFILYYYYISVIFHFWNSPIFPGAWTTLNKEITPIIFIKAVFTKAPYSVAYDSCLSQISGNTDWFEHQHHIWWKGISVELSDDVIWIQIIKCDCSLVINLVKHCKGLTWKRVCVPCLRAGLRGAIGLSVLQKWILDRSGLGVSSRGVCNKCELFRPLYKMTLSSLHSLKMPSQILVAQSICKRHNPET